MTVHNIYGSQGDHYRDIGLRDWMAQKGMNSKPLCSVLGCSSIATDGSHVIKVDNTDKTWYICPLCHEHNEATDNIELKSDWPSRLVPLSRL